MSSIRAPRRERLGRCRGVLDIAAAEGEYRVSELPICGEQKRGKAMQKILWHEMFKDEFEAAVAATPVCYLSYGISEPHGLQNAMGLDGLKAHALVERAASSNTRT